MMVNKWPVNRNMNRNQRLSAGHVNHADSAYFILYLHGSMVAVSQRSAHFFGWSWMQWMGQTHLQMY